MGARYIPLSSPGYLTSVCPPSPDWLHYCHHISFKGVRHLYRDENRNHPKMTKLPASSVNRFWNFHSCSWYPSKLFHKATSKYSGWLCKLNNTLWNKNKTKSKAFSVYMYMMSRGVWVNIPAWLLCVLRLPKNKAGFKKSYMYIEVFFFLSNFVKINQNYTLKTPGSAWPGKGSIGAKLHSGSKMTRKLVSFLQTWQIMGSDWPSSGSHSASGWLISGSSLTRNGVWPQWTQNSDPGIFRVYVPISYFITDMKFW